VFGIDQTPMVQEEGIQAGSPWRFTSGDMMASMGLDVVELVMDIEDEFGVDFTDEAAEHCHTVREVALYVYGLIESRPLSAEICPSARRFHELRDRIESITPNRADALRPKSQVAEALPRGMRRRLWRTAGFALPRLQLPTWGRVFVGLAGLGTFIVVGVCFVVGLRIDASASIVLSGAIAIFLTIALYMAMFPARRELPDGINTLADLVRASLRVERKDGKWASGRPSFAEVLQRTRELASEQSGVPLEMVKPESNLFKDLEMG
jgi:hypothetical protein